ncbi:neutral/alkaline non-lysosomal ceramidase N-terminal domain-containing protein [Lederbergia sp. NSJ-179]|uniref:neutral/alkaline non-lysosomal ceramidase N-terminal domain-containing protein n=1 Tax=Lederbergia sp. NSJ-179 TaxID=2931402 RepID=UPI001FD52850|nr:neutral/alkaline non-lysosomal ceramidase N-terminal domain-containing protein [Lederbergia sp. NSJ-179]MCJ7843107.1 neutral/alkaline non-lysosomal ceramidase N-terminal domain-containing protein [Lederbergia sp. NSJ-179]
MTVYCGSGKKAITPPLGAYFAGRKFKKPAEGVHDPLYARVIAIKNDQQTVVFVSLDILYVDKAYTNQVKEQVNRCFGIHQENMLIHATHNHTGPGGNLAESSPIQKALPLSNGWVGYDDSLVKNQHDQIIKAIAAALQTMEPCELYYGKSRVDGIASNRNNPDQPHNPELQVVECKHPSGQSTVLYHFGCHPTIIDAESRLISADFPGETCRQLETKDTIKFALFLNGPCGEISTRFTRKEATFKEVERMSSLLSDGVLRTLNDTRKITDTDAIGKQQSLNVTVRKFEDEKSLNEKLVKLQTEYEKEKSIKGQSAKVRKLESEIEGFMYTLGTGRQLQGISDLKTYIQLIRLGEMIFIAIPGELFFETGKDIKDQFKDIPLFILGNTNDQIGYIVPEEYYENSDYESLMTLLEKGEAEHIRDSAVHSLYTVIDTKDFRK